MAGVDMLQHPQAYLNRHAATAPTVSQVGGNAQLFRPRNNPSDLLDRPRVKGRE